MGRRLRVSPRSLPIARRGVLPSGMNRPWAESNRYKISELIPFTAAGPPAIHSSSFSFCVRFKIRFQLMMPIRILQHSILGLWLAATQAGTTPLAFNPRSVRRCNSWSSRSLPEEGAKRDDPVAPVVIKSRSTPAQLPTTFLVHGFGKLVRPARIDHSSAFPLPALDQPTN